MNYVHIYQLSIECSKMIIQLFVVLARIIHNDGTIAISINIYHIFHEKLGGYLISTSLNQPNTYSPGIGTILKRCDLGFKYLLLIQMKKNCLIK